MCGLMVALWAHLRRETTAEADGGCQAATRAAPVTRKSHTSGRWSE